MEQQVLVWRKASRSTGSGEDCVEVARLDDVIAVRDSKGPDGPKLAFGRDAFRAFMDSLVDRA